MARSIIQRPVGVYAETGLLNSTKDLNDVVDFGGYSWASTSVPANAPSAKASRMITFGDGTTSNQNRKAQLVVDNTGKIYVRIGGSSGWESWFTHSPNAS